MKLKKIITGISALAIATSGAMIPASAATTTTDYMYTVQTSWSSSSANDKIEGTKPDGSKAKGAGDLKDWDSGDPWNGQWIQIELTSNDSSNTSIEFTVDTSGATFQESPEGEDPMTEWTIIRVADASDTTPYTLIVKDKTKGSYTYTMTSENLKKALAAGTFQLNANPADENGVVTYTMGMNLQIGHLSNAKVTGVVTSDCLYVPSASSDSSSSTDTSSNESTTDSNTESTTDSSTGSSDTGAATGLAFVGIALAGAAVIATKRK